MKIIITGSKRKPDWIRLDIYIIKIHMPVLRRSEKSRSGNAGGSYIYTHRYKQYIYIFLLPNPVFRIRLKYPQPCSTLPLRVKRWLDSWISGPCMPLYFIFLAFHYPVDCWGSSDPAKFVFKYFLSYSTKRYFLRKRTRFCRYIFEFEHIKSICNTNSIPVFHKLFVQ